MKKGYVFEPEDLASAVASMASKEMTGLGMGTCEDTLPISKRTEHQPLYSKFLGASRLGVLGVY